MYHSKKRVNREVDPSAPSPDLNSRAKVSTRNRKIKVTLPKLRFTIPVCDVEQPQYMSKRRS